MWLKNPHCQYCGVETILIDDLNLKGLKTPPNTATIDHKYSRYNPLRNTEKQEYILCCSLCNNYRAQLEEDKIPIEVLRERSRRGVRDGRPQEPYEQPAQEINNENSFAN